MQAYVYGAASGALALVAAIDAQAGFPDDAGTNTYALPLAHPTSGEYAVPANAGGIDTEAMRAAGVFVADDPVTLTDDWFPAVE